MLPIPGHNTRFALRRTFLAMKKPPLRTIFRFLVVASLLLPFLGAAYELAVTSRLSEDEQILLQWSGHGGIFDGVFEAESDGTFSGGPVSALISLAMLVVVLGLLLVQIGLFFFRRWARTWWTVTALVFLPSPLFFGWSVSLPFAQFCYDLSMAMNGGILALCYASPLALAFQPSSTSTSIEP